MSKLLSFEEVVLLARGESDWAEIEDVAKVATELLGLRSKTETQERIIAAYNTSGCSDADAMAIAYLDAKERIAILEEALGDIQEIADRETSNESALLDEIVQRSMDALKVKG